MSTRNYARRTARLEAAAAGWAVRHAAAGDRDLRDRAKAIACRALSSPDTLRSFRRLSEAAKGRDASSMRADPDLRPLLDECGRMLMVNP